MASYHKEVRTESRESGPGGVKISASSSVTDDGFGGSVSINRESRERSSSRQSSPTKSRGGDGSSSPRGGSNRSGSKQDSGSKKDKALSVPIPKGKKPGDKLTLSVHGEKVKCTIPPEHEWERRAHGHKNSGNGNYFSILAPQNHNNGKSVKSIYVTVPHNVHEGDIVEFDIDEKKNGAGKDHHGKKVCVVVPKGVRGGDEMELELFEDFDKKPNKKKDGRR